MTTRQVAEMLRLSTGTIRKMIKRNDIHAEKKGHNWRVLRKELIAQIETKAFELVHKQ